MTGYAAVRREMAGVELTGSLRSVNGRNLDLHFHLGSDFAQFEGTMRQMVRAEVRRGHVEVRFAVAARPGATAGYNRELLTQYLAAFRTAARDFGLPHEPDLNRLIALPGIWEASAAPQLSLDETDVRAALGECLAALNECRTREGTELAAAVALELDEMERHVSALAKLRAGLVAVLQTRFEQRLAALLGNAELPLARLTEEAAILTDRSDVQEELTRLEVHVREARRMLAEGGDVGKQLDFLMQEMNREANTVLSKTAGLGEAGLAITNLGLALKANIERIREQALNLE